MQYVYSQNQKEADSLKRIYESGERNGEAKLELLNNLAFHSTSNFKESIGYADELINEALKSSNYLYVYRGYIQKGQTYRIAGNITEALNTFIKASEIAEKLKNEKYLGGGYLTIADTYSEIENNANAELYYQKAIAILSRTDDYITLGSAYLNSGYHYYLKKEYDQALANYKASNAIFDKLEYPIGIAYNIGNIGMVYAEQGRDLEAMQSINEAIETLEQFEDYYAISEYLSSMSNVYVSQKKFSKALEYDHKSLDMAKKYGLKKQISASNFSLSNLYEKLGNTDASLQHFKEHVLYRDSIKNLEAIENMANMRTDFEVAQEQAKTTISEQKRKNQKIILWSTIGVLFLIGILAIGLYNRNKYIKSTNKIIATEKERSDQLLLNILPEDTAQELKDNGRVEAKKFPSVTVLFSDFKGFTSYAEKLSPEELVDTIEYYFSNFDLIMDKYGLEKIKTIGDSYMAVGGLSFDKVNQAKEMLLAAKEMNDFVSKAKIDNITSATFDIRIGINTGPVVAGVVGTRKFAYDIWGDTVNIASRMESNSKAGRINISENTYQIIKNDFDCEYRGELAVKNRGEMKMYFVNT
ncbi:adenylate/guanylate cyclase domain-containing protein [Winogradskyella vincentii]|uniref:Tetratricopeptide repeat protein n=1 Tax=Winogradskyella vincentii TaxID=2877122 RepID=A0ABS7XZI3_9FLAO|nr:adenylate/guanylate cyclase domain-containing protein [Winogradskyella vincentii]MCA0153069.1 tetratricopeptide repeat protein [Winogradskyella vincentii]